MGNRSYALTSACPELQSVYDRCEKSHLDAFRRGEASIDNPCRDAWEDYKQCVMDVWDAKTSDYLARRAAERGETLPPPPSAPHTAAPPSTTAAAASTTPTSVASTPTVVVTSTAASASADDTASSDPQ